MKLALKVFSVSFIFFIIWVLYTVNTNTKNQLFDFAKQIPNYDKILHFSLLAVLTFSLNYLLNWKVIKAYKIRLLVGSLILIIIFTLEEFSQLFISVRTFDLLDLTFNLLGILFVSFIYFRINKNTLND